MSSSAIIMMLLVQVPVTCMCGFLFWKVMTTPQKPEPDSYTDNDMDEN